jgi:hypothetical protein
MRQSTLSAILIAVGVSLLLSYWYMVTPVPTTVQGLVLTSVTPTLTVTQTLTPTPTASPTYIMPTVVGLKSDPRCVGASIAGATKYVLVGADSFMTVGSLQSPLTFSGGDRSSGLGLAGYCEVIVDRVRFFHKLPGTPTPAPSATPTPTSTRTLEPPKVVASAAGCSVLAEWGRFIVPQGTRIWYLSGGQFRPSTYGFRGGEALAIPVEEREGRCKTNARSDAVGDWWFLLTDVQLPSTLPPTPTPVPATAPAFGQTPNPVSVAPGLLNVTVEDEQKSQLTVRPTYVVEALASQGYKNPANIKFVWKTQDEVMALLQPRVAPVPADIPNGSISEKGVAKIYLNSAPATVSGVEAEIAKALAQLVLEQKSNHQVDPTEGGKDVALARQAIAAYKFIDQDIKAAQVGKLSVTVTGSGPYPVNAREIAKFITDQGLSYPAFKIIWRTGDQLTALSSQAAPSLGPQAVAPAIFNAILVPADLDGFDSLNVQGLSEKGTVKIFISTKIEGSNPNQTLAHEVARLIARYVKGMTDNNGGRGDSAITGVEKELLRTYTGVKAFVGPKAVTTGLVAPPTVVSQTPVACGGLDVSVYRITDVEEEKSPTMVDVNGWACYFAQSGWRSPKPIKVHWVSSSHMARLVKRDDYAAFIVPASEDMDQSDPFRLAEPGVINIYLQNARGAETKIDAAHEACRVVYRYVKGDKTFGGTGYNPNDPVNRCEGPVAAKYSLLKARTK